MSLLPLFSKPATRLAFRPYAYLPTMTRTFQQRPFTCSPRHREDPHTDTKIIDRLSMHNKTILVTGGGRGIGFAICKSIAQLGGNIAVLDSLPSPVQEFKTLADRYGVSTLYERTDVTDQKSLESAFKHVVNHTGSVEGCVTAAGIGLDAPFFEQSWDACRQILDVNVMGTFWTARLAAEHMKARGKGGSIVLIASVAAQGVKVPLQNMAIYNMSKAAVKGLVGPLAVELGELGVRINSVSPGVIESPMTAGMKETFPELEDMFNNAAPVKRKGRPSDLTPMIAYLLSDASEFTTGSDFLITGGLHAGISPSWLKKS